MTITDGSHIFLTSNRSLLILQNEKNRFTANISYKLNADY